MNGIFVFTLSPNKVTVSPNNPAQIGDYKIRLKLCLENYSSVCRNEEFYVKVSECTVNLMLANKEWIISSLAAFGYDLS